MEMYGWCCGRSYLHVLVVSLEIFINLKSAEGNTANDPQILGSVDISWFVANDMEFEYFQNRRCEDIYLHPRILKT
jgi:hypothetical protein